MRPAPETTGRRRADSEGVRAYRPSLSAAGIQRLQARIVPRLDLDQRGGAASLARPAEGWLPQGWLNPRFSRRGGEHRLSCPRRGQALAKEEGQRAEGM